MVEAAKPRLVGLNHIALEVGDVEAALGLTPSEASQIAAPLIGECHSNFGECHSNFECKLVGGILIKRYSLFVFEVVKAHVTPKPEFPRTIYYRGNGTFMLSGTNTARYRRLFKSENL